MPKNVPLEECERIDGILIYNSRELVRRNCRRSSATSHARRPATSYDAGWIVCTHPETINDQDRKSLKNWADSKNPVGEPSCGLARCRR